MKVEVKMKTEKNELDNYITESLMSNNKYINIKESFDNYMYILSKTRYIKNDKVSLTTEYIDISRDFYEICEAYLKYDVYNCGDDVCMYSIFNRDCKSDSSWLIEDSYNRTEAKMYLLGRDRVMSILEK